MPQPISLWPLEQIKRTTSITDSDGIAERWISEDPGVAEVRHGGLWRPRRTVTALVALTLLLLAGLFLRVLIADWSDDAYLDLALLGNVLLLASVPFIIATLLPDSLLRRIVLGLAMAGLVWLFAVGLLGGVIVIGSLVGGVVRGNWHAPRGFTRHLIGYVLLVSAVSGGLLLLVRSHRL
jgi:hypothetical protein